MAKSIFLVINGVGLPEIHSDDQKTWLDTDAGFRFAQILGAILHAGFKGVRAEAFRSPSGFALYNFGWQLATPEGRLVCTLAALARAGGPILSVSESLRILKRVYRKEGLTIPTPILRHERTGATKT